MNILEKLGDKITEDLTKEQLLEILRTEKVEDIEKLKNSVTKANKEASDYKKQLNQYLTEDEKRKQEEQAAREKLQESYDLLLKETTIAKSKAKYLSLGYDEKLAENTAEALFNGDMDIVFDNQRKFNESLEKKIKAEVIDSTPRPKGGNSTNSFTRDDLQKMSLEDRLNFAEKNPDEYKQIYEGE